MAGRWIAVDGNEACADVAYRLSDVIAIYPITPSSRMPSSAEASSYFPGIDGYALGPDRDLEQSSLIKRHLGVPVIGPLNGTTAEEWLAFARLIERAGADALELNFYHVATDPARCPDPASFERGNCVRILQSWHRAPRASAPLLQEVQHDSAQADPRRH